MTDDEINESMAKDASAYTPSTVPLWRFTVEADRLQSGKYVVTVRTRSGRVVVRNGYHPLWELIRILAGKSLCEAPMKPTKEKP